MYRWASNLSKRDSRDWTAATGRRPRVLSSFWSGLPMPPRARVWVHPLLWTVLPAGVALYLRADRYPWRVILIFVMPITLLDGVGTGRQRLVRHARLGRRFRSISSPASCSRSSWPIRNRRSSACPAGLWASHSRRGWSERASWNQSKRRTRWSRRSIRRDDRANTQAEIHRLATEARLESQRTGTWQDAWATHAGWLEGLENLLDGRTRPTMGSVTSTILRPQRTEAENKAIERAKALELAGTES